MSYSKQQTVIFYRGFSRNSSDDVGPITRMRQLRETLDPRYLGGRDIGKDLSLDLQPPSSTQLTVMEWRRPDYRVGTYLRMSKN